MKKKPKILKNNSVYRFGDLFHRKGQRYTCDRKAILTNPEYEGTILFDYLSQVGNRNSIGLLRKITFQHIDEKGYSIPDDDELVVHLRLGDYFHSLDRGKRMQGRSRRKFEKCRNKYSDFLSKVPSDKINKISIVTALHFGANDVNGRFFYNEDDYNKSIEILNIVIECCERYGFKPEMVSGEVDADFAYLISAKFLYKGKRRFSKLAAKCCMGRVYE